MQAIKWARSYSEEFKLRKETEMELKEAREELEKMRFVYESRITEACVVGEKLLDKYKAAVQVLRRGKKDRNELKTERDIAIKEAEKLKSLHEKIFPSDKHREAPHYFICPITQVKTSEKPKIVSNQFIK